MRLILSTVFIVSMSMTFNLVAKPVVIAHRAASGYLPEHTLEAVTLAFTMNPDFIEQDLVLTKDLVPVVLHDIHLDTVTDVAQKYPGRQREDGRYYALDFTLAEIKSLKVHERTELDGKQVFANRYSGKAGFAVATFAEELELISELNRQFGKNIGFYPEIKSPEWHKAQGVDISVIVLAMLREYGLDDADKAIYVQCFDFAETQRWRNELGVKVKLIQLIGENDWNEAPTDYDYLLTPAGLAEVAKVAQGIGPWIPQLVDLDSKQATTLAKDAHAAGLAVHPYTYRRDALPEGVTEKQVLDMLFKQQKVNGLFSDFPNAIVEYLKK
jgi:glycerophosphoryl diester phosphodiesterase